MERKTLTTDTVLALCDGTTLKLCGDVVVEHDTVVKNVVKPGWEKWDELMAKYKPLQHVHSRYQQFSKFNSFSK